jgi:hypothetical protein
MQAVDRTRRVPKTARLKPAEQFGFLGIKFLG